MNLLALVLISTAAFSWATAQVISKKVLNQIGTTFFNAIRLSVIIPLLISSIFLTGNWNNIPLNGYLLLAISSGALGVFGGSQLFFYLMTKAKAHQVIPIGNSQLFWIVLLSVILLNEIITIFLFISAILIFSGSFFLVTKKNQMKEQGGKNRFEWKILLAIFVAFLWGLKVILNKYCLDGGFVYSTLLLVEVSTAAALSTFTLAIGGHIKKSKNFGKNVGISIASGISGLFIGEQLYLMALKIEQASTLAPFIGATVLFGFLLSILILTECPSKKAVLGTVFISLGLALVTF